MRAPTFLTANVLCRPTGLRHPQIRILLPPLARAENLRRQCTLQANLRARTFHCANVLCRLIGLRDPQTRILMPPPAHADILQHQCTLQTNWFEASPSENSATTTCARRQAAAPMHSADQSVRARTFHGANDLCKPIEPRNPQTRIPLPPLARADILLCQCTLQTNRFEASPKEVVLPPLARADILQRQGTLQIKVCACERSTAPMFSEDRSVCGITKQEFCCRHLDAPTFPSANVFCRLIVSRYP